MIEPHENEEPIVKNEARVLTPKLYERFREQLNPLYRAIADVQINSGMRWTEFWTLIHHKELYKASRRCISIISTKEKARVKERDIILTQKGCEAVEILLKLKPKEVSRHAVNQAFKLAAQKSIGEEYVMPKMLRKCCATWLVKAFQENPTKLAIISLSMGHTFKVMQTHYLCIAFSPEDTADMRDFFRGWGE